MPLVLLSRTLSMENGEHRNSNGEKSKIDHWKLHKLYTYTENVLNTMYA